jgi:hypothetical protein
MARQRWRQCRSNIFLTLRPGQAVAGFLWFSLGFLWFSLGFLLVFFCFLLFKTIRKL